VCHCGPEGSLLFLYCSKDIRARIAKAKGVMAIFSNVRKSKQISYKTKINMLRTRVFSAALFACETWTLKKTDKDLILTFEMYCYIYEIYYCSDGHRK